MLNAEEAKARLTTLADPNWRGAARKRIGRLRHRSTQAATVLLIEWGPSHELSLRQKFEADLIAAATVIDALSEKDRLAFMTALHPSLGSALARWWIDARGQPYMTGWLRRGFRAPNSPNITLRNRAHALRDIVSLVGPYDRDPVWLAAWAPHIENAASSYSRGFPQMIAGPVLAAAIDIGGPTGDGVLQTLIDIGNGVHPVGVMDRHVIVALLRASRPAGWEFVERMLLAAQRQEGLRQSILEVVDEAHPEAFTRMLDLVVGDNLLRFAATVRAAGTWIGFGGDVQEIPQIADRLRRLRLFRGDPAACEHALTAGDAWDTYLALISVAMHDVFAALQWSESVFARSDIDARAAAARFVAISGLTSAQPRLLKLLDDPSLDVAALANSFVHFQGKDGTHPQNAFDILERFARRLPATPRAGALVGIEAAGPSLGRAGVVAKMLSVRDDRPLSLLMPWVPDMDANTRVRLARAAGAATWLTADVREVLVMMVGDRSSSVRVEAVKAMGEVGVNASEAPALEGLLTRRAGDLRRGVIRLLARQKPDDAVASARRLWGTGRAEQRDAACELLGAIAGNPAVARTAGLAIAADGPTAQQRELLDPVIGSSKSTNDEPLQSGITTYGLEGRTPPLRPRPVRRAGFVSDASPRILDALDDLAHQHRDTALTVYNWQGSTEVLLADAKWLPSPFRAFAASTDQENEDNGLILAHVFRDWWPNRPADCRQTDGLDALQAYAMLLVDELVVRRAFDKGADDWWRSLLRSVGGGNVGQLRHAPVVRHVLEWLLVDEVSAAAADECLDAFETLLAGVPAHVVKDTPPPRPPEAPWKWDYDWRHIVHNNPWSLILNGLRAARPTLLDAAQLGRWLGLERWIDEPIQGAKRQPVPRHLVQAGAKLGVATDDDIRECLLDRNSRMLTDFTRRRRQQLETEYPRVVILADEMRAWVIQTERARGELQTPASVAATSLGSIVGADVTMEFLGRLGRAALVRGHSFGNYGREAVYSHLLRVSYPADTDGATDVNAAARAASVSDKRLIELAVFAPQWARLVGEALAWDGFDDAVWWFHAHTKDDQWSVDHEVRETWAALSAERTPLSGDDLVSGAVDTSWFTRAHATLGGQRWAALHAAAKMASGGSGHRRAQLFAEAMLGDVSEGSLLARMAATRHQDSVRALGLVPLPSDPSDRTAVTLSRYLALREFERGSSKFGNQRQTSERAAVRIGVENLARTAGFVDPQRFIWSIEAAEAGDLADGAVVVVDGDVTVTLSVDAEGLADMAVVKAGKPLKSVPANLRKSPGIAALRDRKTALTRQASRVRASLEAAMVRQERFTEGDLNALDRHPVVAPMLRLAVFVDELGQTFRRNDAVFLDALGAVAAPVGDVRMAHPIDLLHSGDWTHWQQQLFTDERRQPFKQVFRELYVVTETERSQSPVSHRYDGHQIQPRQAMALFGRRGWLTDREAGDVSRVFHQHGFVARVQFLNGFLTPAEVELPAISGVHFTTRGEYTAQPIAAVPPVVFSETMRDLDLVVSVAHAGGVDPETTASTVEMRAALVRETMRLAKLDNVRLLDNHVVIDGTLGEYSIHLGSGVVHRRPGGSICIIPIDSQRRGRIFLPFADDDPKTAEVMAKVLLLAKDKQIKDPTILEQLRSS